MIFPTLSVSPNAIISAYNKDGIAAEATALISLGFTIWASGGTATHLEQKFIPVKQISRIVGEAILNHRVVTLSREIHAGLLALQNGPDLEELEKLGVPFMDLVRVDMYPFKEVSQTEGNSIAKIVENIDIGGPAMLRSGEKGGRIVVCRPTDMQRVIRTIQRKKDVPVEERNRLAAVAEETVGHYCLQVAKWRRGLSKAELLTA